MRLLILTPETVLLEAEEITHIRTTLSDGGGIGIRPGHHPLLADTLDGDLVYTQDGERQSVGVRAGILRVAPEQVTLYTSGWLNAQPAPPTKEPTRLDELTRELEEQLEEGL